MAMLDAATNWLTNIAEAMDPVLSRDLTFASNIWRHTL